MAIPSAKLVNMLPYAAVVFQIGIMLSALWLMKCMISKPEYSRFLGSGTDDPEPDPDVAPPVPREVEVFTVDGLFTLGAFYKFDEISRSASPVQPKVRIVRLKQVRAVDPSGLFHLRTFRHICDQKGIKLIFSDVRPRVLKALKDLKADDVARDQMMFLNFGDALSKAREFL